MSRLGRPSILTKLHLTQHDLEQLYEQLGTYAAVAKHLHVTKRTIVSYLTKKGKRPRGRPQGYYTSKIRLMVQSDPQTLTLSSTQFVQHMDQRGQSPTYARKLYHEYQSQLETHVIHKVKSLLRQNVAIRDTKGRYIPTSAIRYVWIPHLHWDRPIFIKVVLKDRTKAKLPTMITVSPQDIIEPSVSTDQSPEHSSTATTLD